MLPDASSHDKPAVFAVLCVFIFMYSCSESSPHVLGNWSLEAGGQRLIFSHSANVLCINVSLSTSYMLISTEYTKHLWFVIYDLGENVLFDRYKAIFH